MEIEEKEIMKEVRKIRKSVTHVWIAITGLFAVIFLILCSMDLLNKEAIYYFIGILFGFIGLIVRSFSMEDYVDWEKCIDKDDIKYRLYNTNEQRKIIFWAYYFKYPILIILTILAFVSFSLLTIDLLLKPPIALIFVGSISMIVGFVLKLPGWFS